MNVLITGTGSIGQRHIQNITRLYPEAKFIILRRETRVDELSKSLHAEVQGHIDEALKLQPDFALVATPSARHIDALIPLIDAGIPLYIEKPVVTTRPDVARLRSQLKSAQYSAPNLVGCNLRFLPSLIAMRETVLSGKLGRIVRAQLTAGQWLPDWRPEQDYRQSYSAKMEMGGGVIMDLIHEIDMARWLFGEFSRVRGLVGKFSSLEIDCEDTAGILLGDSKEGPMVSITLDYVSRKPVRRYEIVGEEATLIWDLQKQSLEIMGAEHTESIDCGATGFDMADTYRIAMKEFLSALQKPRSLSPDMEDGLKSVELALTAKEEGQR